MDVGQPADYLLGMGMRLDALKNEKSNELYQKKEGDDFQIIQPVIIHPTAKGKAKGGKKKDDIF